MSSPANSTRERILEAALDHVQKTDDLSFRMQDIAEIAGLSRQAIYLHFDGRPDLLVQMVQYLDQKEGLARRASRVWEAESPVEALHEFVDLQAEYNPRIYRGARLLMKGRYRDEALQAAWEDRMESRRRACRRLVRWLKDEGQLAPDWDLEGAVDLLWAATSIQVWESLVHGRGYSPEKYVAHTSRLIHGGLLGSASTS